MNETTEYLTEAEAGDTAVYYAIISHVFLAWKFLNSYADISYVAIRDVHAATDLFKYNERRDYIPLYQLYPPNYRRRTKCSAEFCIVCSIYLSLSLSKPYI